MSIRGSAYLAYAILISIIGTIISFVVFSIIGFAILPSLDIYPDNIMIIILLIIPLLIGIGIFYVLIILPGNKANTRAKKIDTDLAYALNFISTMTSAGVTPTESFKSLSKQEIYGEVKEEASWIYRDVALLGKDIISAIKANIKRTQDQ